MLKDWVAGIVALLLLFIGLFFLLFTFALVLFLPFAIGYFLVAYLILKTLNKKEQVEKRLFWLGSGMVLLFIVVFIYFAGLPVGVPCGEWNSFSTYDLDCECIGIMTGGCPLGSICEGGKFGCIGICQNCVTKMDYRQLYECRSAATQCNNVLVRYPDNPCAHCDSACIHENGSEVFSGAIQCCKLGSASSMNILSTGCKTNATQAQACVQTGGNITDKSCCSYAQDFRNACMGYDDCDCAPENSHMVKYCDCGPDRCWDSGENTCRDNDWIRSCRSIAARCNASLASNPNDPCADCEQWCVNDAGEVLPGALNCCRQGRSEQIYAGSTECFNMPSP